MSALPEVNALTACIRIALSRHGVLARAEALATGLSKSALHRAIRAGKLQWLLPGVLSVPGAPCTWYQKLTATCMWAGSFTVVSHRAAAALFELDDCPAGIVEISMPAARRAPRPGIVIHRIWIPPEDRVEISGIPVTAPTRTLLDLAAVVDIDRLELALEDALRRRLTSIPRIKWELQKAGGRKGVRAMARLLEIRGEGARPTASALETRVLQVLRAGGIPAPVRQHPIRGATKKRYIDFAYPDVPYFIECQSFRWHSGRGSWHSDQARLNELLELGWRGVMVTDDDLRYQRQEFLDKVRRGLGLP